MARGFIEYFSNEENIIIVQDIIEEIEFEKNQIFSNSENLNGKTFVITGSLDLTCFSTSLPLFSTEVTL